MTASTAPVGCLQFDLPGAALFRLRLRLHHRAADLVRPPGYAVNITIAEIAKSVFIYLGVPFLGGLITRFSLIKLKDKRWYHSRFILRISVTQSVPLVEPDPLTFSDKADLVGQREVPDALRQWLGAGPAVLIKFNPGNCGADDDWESAGLLIRGAALYGADGLQLTAPIAAGDLNWIDITDDHLFQQDSWGTADVEITPQWQAPIAWIKKSLLGALAGAYK